MNSTEMSSESAPKVVVAVPVYWMIVTVWGTATIAGLVEYITPSWLVSMKKEALPTDTLLVGARQASAATLNMPGY